MKKPTFVNNEIYHVYNRGVEKRKIFLDKQDFLRFIHCMFEFNDEIHNINTLRKLNSKNENNKKKKRNPLVEILIFCLMPNHFHFILKQKRDDGIIKFMQKLGTGYAMYFNQKYDRVGGLFQGRFKAVLIEKEPHFIHLPYYIHLNPIELINPKWKEKKIKNIKETINFLNSYRWSSYLDYIGIKNFPSVTSRELLSEFFNGPKEYKLATEKWLKEIDLEQLQNIIIEK